MRWRFVLAESSTLEPITILSQARDRQLNVIHDRPGGASFRMPITADFAEDIVPFNKAIRVLRWNWRASQIAGEPVWDDIWSGFIYNIEEDISGNSMTVQVVGWLSRLDQRFTRRQIIYTDYDDADILIALINEMNMDPGPDGYNFTPMAGSSSLTLLQPGSKLPNEGVGGSTAYVPAPRGVRTYELNTQVLPEFYNLMNLENGCDLYVDPVTRVVDFYRKKQIIRDNAVFGFGTAINNISQVSRSIDPAEAVNYMLVRGRDGFSAFAHDLVSMGIYGPLEKVANITELVTTEDMLAFVGGEIIVLANGKITHAMTPFPYSIGSNVPEPFVDYNVGDRTYFSAKQGKRINIQNQGIRVFGINVNIQDDGGETIGPLQLAPES